MIERIDTPKSALQREYERRFPSIDPNEVPDWLANPVAMEALDPDTVLKPWTPVEVVDRSVRVWGRRYDLGAWGLPSQIETAGQEILAAPIRLEIVPKGAPEAVTSDSATLVDRFDGRARFRSASLDQVPLTVEVISTFEYDGFSRFDLSLAAHEQSAVDRMELVIAIKPEYARFFNWVRPVWPGESREGRTHSGVIPDGSGDVYVTDFKLIFWIGDHQRGIAWFTESDQYWWPFRQQGAIRIVRHPDRVELRIGMITAPGSPLPTAATLSFGLMATPIKPLPEGWRNWRFGGQYDSRLYPHVVNHEVHWFTRWQIVPHYPVPRDVDAFRELFANDRRSGIQRSYPYLDVTLMSRGTNVIVPGEDFVFIPPEYVAFGRDWEIDPPREPGSLARVTTASGWADFALAQVKSWILEAGANGIYLDEASPRADMSAEHGMGYLDHTGKRQPTFALYATRDFYKRLAYLFQEYGDGIPALFHHGSVDYPYIGFADIILTGESMEGAINDWPGPDPPSYIELVPPERWQTQYIGKQLGLVQVMLPQFKSGAMQRFPGILQQSGPTRDMLAMVLLHDIHVWPIWSNARVVVDAYRVLAHFNTGTSDVVFRPYWETAAQEWVSPDGVLVSYYERPREIMAIVTNTTKQSLDVTLDWARVLKNKEITGAVDGEQPVLGKVNAIFRENKITLTVGPRDFRLVRISLDEYPVVDGIIIKSPRGAVVEPNAPIIVDVEPDVSVNEITVLQNGMELYRGSAIPEELRLRGTIGGIKGEPHRLTVIVLDKEGKERRHEIAFDIDPVRLYHPVPSERVQGETTVTAALALPADERISKARVLAWAVRDGRRAEEHVVYEGSTWPGSLAFDSRSIADGTYDVQVIVDTDQGEQYCSEAHRIVIRNWDVLTDPLDPPIELPLFGEMPRSKALDQSDGWTYATDRPQLFFGDDSRLVPVDGGVQHLTWRHRQIRRFVFTVYARTRRVTDNIRIFVSDAPDRDWIAVSYKTDVIERPDSEWLQIRVLGDIPANVDAAHIRFVWEGTAETTGFQLGHAEIFGVP